MKRNESSAVWPTRIWGFLWPVGTHDIDFQFPYRTTRTPNHLLLGSRDIKVEEMYHILERRNYIMTLREPATRKPETTSPTYNQTTLSPPGFVSVCGDTWYIMHSSYQWLNGTTMQDLTFAWSFCALCSYQHINLGIGNGLTYEVESNQTIAVRNTTRAFRIGSSRGIFLMHFPWITSTCQMWFAKQLVR